MFIETETEIPSFPGTSLNSTMIIFLHVDWFGIRWCWCYGRRVSCCSNWASEDAGWWVNNSGEGQSKIFSLLLKCLLWEQETSNVHCLVLIIFIDFKILRLFISHCDIIYKLMALICHGHIIFKHGFLFSLGFLVQIHWLTLLYRPYWEQLGSWSSSSQKSNIKVLSMDPFQFL